MLYFKNLRTRTKVFSSVLSLVGGVVADVFEADTRGVPMSMFAFLILAGQGLGAVVFGESTFELTNLHVLKYDRYVGWVEMSIGFRWIAWSTFCFVTCHASILIGIFSQHDNQWSDDCGHLFLTGGDPWIENS